MRRTRSVFVCAALALAAACTDAPAPDAGAVVVLDTPAGDGAGQANLGGGGGAPLYLSWQEPADDGATALRFARFESGQWLSAATIARGSDWFVNWADYGSVVPLLPPDLSSDHASDGSQTVFAHWLTMKPNERYAYDITYAVSSDAGGTWSSDRVLNGDTAIAEHGFVSFFQWGDDIGAVWLDGRAVAALTIDEMFELEEPVGMTLRYARMRRDGTVVERGEIDDLVCDCCQTDAVTTEAGPLIVYRDRTVDEVRDVVVRRATIAERTIAERASGQGSSARWSEPVAPAADGWVIDGCPVNGPAIAASGSHVGVAWFTAAENRPRLRFARSADAGNTFQTALTLADEGVLGQVDVAIQADGTAWVSAWHRAPEDAPAGMQLRVHRVDARSNAVRTHVIAESAERLPVDVPQMALSGGSLVFAWSQLADASGNPGRLYSARMTISPP